LRPELRKADKQFQQKCAAVLRCELQANNQMGQFLYGNAREPPECGTERNYERGPPIGCGAPSGNG